ncbi:unnamed protein product [Cyprideis torosa]|uniref:Uncharacterized protein n=1 Tax=Cyprideis torosa TaxID=163714 RepID=A0A7R8W0I4_9CRUS|nr:unnamed protein product [Cyprideis torosa]CAG0878737.1 unnamed protein product [Cyprideis torosa]
MAFLANIFSSAVFAEEQLLDRIVAVVNDGVILQSEVSQELIVIRQQAREAGQQLPSDDILSERVLERLILNKVQMQQAEKTGINVDEDTLNRAITSIARNNNMDLARFRQALQAQGIAYQTFRESIREELTIARLRTRDVDSKINISSREIDNYLRRNNDTSNSSGSSSSYKIQHILIGLPEGASAEQINSANDKALEVLALIKKGGDFAKLAATYSDGAKALDGGSIGWRSLEELPQLFADSLKELSVGQTSQPLRSANGFHLLRVEDIQNQDKQIATETRVRHILLRDAGNARQQLLALKQRIESGASFAELAREFSEDSNSTANGGELPWFRSGEMVPEFEKVAESLPIGSISEPFQSSFGWHIVETLERRAYNASEESKRAEAEMTIKKVRSDEEYELWLRKLRSEAYVEIRDANR